MELVPIVIEVLKIVTIFAVVTLTISYIAFKIRQRSAPPKNFNAEPVSDLKPNFINRSIRKLTQMTQEIIVSPSKSPTPPKPPQSSKPKDQKVIKPPEKQKPKPPKVESKEEIKSKRIEILSPQKREEVKPESILIPEKEEKAKMQSLGEDVLDKYLDDEHSDLYTLKTKKEEKK